MRKEFEEEGEGKEEEAEEEEVRFRLGSVEREEEERKDTKSREYIRNNFKDTRQWDVIEETKKKLAISES